MKVIETSRLLLRTFNDTDLDAMATINADPDVMRHFPSVASRQQTQDHIARINKHQQQYGYSLYAVALKVTGEMIGFVGLLHRTREEFNAPCMPATEIGWRLSSKHWGQGYATEAAHAVVDFAFNTLELNDIISFTTEHNTTSRHIMKKIGMHHNAKDDFDHPFLDNKSPLCRHVLYRLSKDDYNNS